MRHELEEWWEKVREARTKARKVTTSRQEETVEIPVEYSTWIFIQAVLWWLHENWKLHLSEAQSTSAIKKTIRITLKYPTADDRSGNVMVRFV